MIPGPQLIENTRHADCRASALIYACPSPASPSAPYNPPLCRRLPAFVAMVRRNRAMSDANPSQTTIVQPHRIADDLAPRPFRGEKSSSCNSQLGKVTTGGAALGSQGRRAPFQPELGCIGKSAGRHITSPHPPLYRGGDVIPDHATNATIAHLSTSHLSGSKFSRSHRGMEGDTAQSASNLLERNRHNRNVTDMLPLTHCFSLIVMFVIFVTYISSS